MKVLKFILGGIAVIFIVVFTVSLFLSKSYYLERSIEIKAPAENIYPLIGELRNWSQWSPWHELDPDMSLTFGSTTTGVGGNYSWFGEEAGEGKIEITEFEPPDKVAFHLIFKGWEDSPSTCAFNLTPSGDGQTVSWSFSGEFSGNPIKRYFGLMFETMVGGEYEKGLANLKALVEAE
jgi:uncharacterized protein YndB with AHSA1/START domain